MNRYPDWFTSDIAEAVSQLEARGYRFAFGENPDLSQVFYGHKRDLDRRIEDRMSLARNTRFDSFAHRWPLVEAPCCIEPGKLTANLNVNPLKHSAGSLKHVLLDVLAWDEVRRPSPRSRRDRRGFIQPLTTEPRYPARDSRKPVRRTP